MERVERQVVAVARADLAGLHAPPGRPGRDVVRDAAIDERSDLLAFEELLEERVHVDRITLSQRVSDLVSAGLAVKLPETGRISATSRRRLARTQADRALVRVAGRTNIIAPSPNR